MTPKIFVLCSYPLKQVGSVQSDNTAGSIYELSAGKKMSAGISCLPLTQELLPLCFYLSSGAYRTRQWCWFNSLPQQKVHLAKMKPPVNRSWVSTLKSKLREPAVSKGRKGRAGADIFGLLNHQKFCRFIFTVPLFYSVYFWSCPFFIPGEICECCYNTILEKN